LLGEKWKKMGEVKTGGSFVKGIVCPMKMGGFDLQLVPGTVKLRP